MKYNLLKLSVSPLHSKEREEGSREKKRKCFKKHPFLRTKLENFIHIPISIKIIKM